MPQFAKFLRDRREPPLRVLDRQVDLRLGRDRTEILQALRGRVDLGARLVGVPSEITQALLRP